MPSKGPNLELGEPLSFNSKSVTPYLCGGVPEYSTSKTRILTMVSKG